MKRRWGPGVVVSVCVANPGFHGVGRLPTGDIRVCVYNRIFLIEAFPSTPVNRLFSLVENRKLSIFRRIEQTNSIVLLINPVLRLFCRN